MVTSLCFIPNTIFILHELAGFEFEPFRGLISSYPSIAFVQIISLTWIMASDGVIITVTGYLVVIYLNFTSLWLTEIQ